MTGTTTFYQGKLGGGGFVVDIDISDDGLTRTIMTDVHGAYIWSFANDEWEQVLTASRFPTFQPTRGGAGYSVYVLKPAPSLSTRLYMITPGAAKVPNLVWRSDDRGQTWYTPNASYEIHGTSTLIPRLYGPGMAVDPNDPDTVYVSDSAGVIHRTFDGGVNWERVDDMFSQLVSLTTTAQVASAGTSLPFASLPSVITSNFTSDFGMVCYAPDSPTVLGRRGEGRIFAISSPNLTCSFGMNGILPDASEVLVGGKAAIAFDRSSGVDANGRTNRIYFGWTFSNTYKTGSAGIWTTADAGATFSLMSGSPDAVLRMVCSHDGVLYLTQRGATVAQNTFRYVSTPPSGSGLSADTWTTLTAPFGASIGARTIAADPQVPGKVIVQFGQGGNLQRSNNYGTTWVGYYSSAPVRVAGTGDVPWHAFTLEDSMGSGNIVFDPIESNLLWYAEGIGVWTTNPRNDALRPTWTSISRGNDELIIDDMSKPPGGKLILATQDRGVFWIDDPAVYPDEDGPPHTSQIKHAWSVSYVPSTPTFLLHINNTSVYWNANGGQNPWTECLTKVPSVNAGGNVVGASTTNFVWFPSNNGRPGYTTDGGDTWSSCTFDNATLNANPHLGWSFSQYLNRDILTVDHVNGHYYAFCYGVNGAGTDASGAGIYRSEDGGANFTRVSTYTNMSDGSAALFNQDHAKLRAVPGNAGHLFFAGGENNNTTTHPVNNYLRYSADGGATWTRITTARDVVQFGFGKEKPGTTYPTIFIWGWANGDTDPGLYKLSGNGVPGASPTWELITRAAGGRLDAITTVEGDLDEYGVSYIGWASSGFSYSEYTPPQYGMLR